MHNFMYHTKDNALLRAQRLADLLHCADHLAISGAEDSQRFISILVDIASDYAQALVNELDAGEMSAVKTGPEVRNA
ncbi:hypothetical protein [Rahnella sp. ChDrAdgB13]|uniref:hypothetical protein n=1 Tax=Rahnella sp. ChDrAdgB13 TaxID=1850581 RepID=UPI001AD8639B|nr:hypothetical protein [Rahnella sp. ChDrAdgB13]